MLSSEQKHVTRFIALANVGNPDKKKRVRECTVHITYYIYMELHIRMKFRVALGKKFEGSNFCLFAKRNFYL